MELNNKKVKNPFYKGLEVPVDNFNSVSKNNEF